jgi:hypothetical protein
VQVRSSTSARRSVRHEDWTPFLFAAAGFASLVARCAVVAPLVDGALTEWLLGVRFMGVSSRIEERWRNRATRYISAGSTDLARPGVPVRVATELMLMVSPRSTEPLSLCPRRIPRGQKP